MAEWEKIAADKRVRLEKTIPPEWKLKGIPDSDSFLVVPAQTGILSDAELAITESSATDLVAKLASGELKAVDVTLAFCKRAAIAHQLVNCSLEFFPELALAQARDLDVYWEQNKKPVGPLHGLPISLKDQFRVKGLETSMGYISWLNKYETDESVMVTLLRKAGAVFYVKTSVPQTLMCCETINNIIGRTLNPRNKNWSCGGSSGGEGAMVGGSIRVPSAFNFLYGIRPSHGRMPYARMANSMEGQETVHSVTGPIAHSAADIRLFLTSILSEEPWKYDSKVIPLEWRAHEEAIIKNKLQSGGLTIGFYNCDGVVLPHPPILRGVETVVSTLKKNGHEVVEWPPYKHDYAVDLISAIYTSDGGADVRRDISASGEPVISNITDLLDPSIQAVDMVQLWDVQLQKWRYQSEYLEKWREMEVKLGKELDAIIAPVTATAAVRHNQFRYYGYASAINLLDFTSVVVPVTFADKGVDVKNEGHAPFSEVDRLVQAEYDPEAYHGAPVAVQVIGRRLSEERTLAIAEEIGRLLGNVVTP
ncbi:acetamidase [Talaromyces proteolyticus]|uniref:Acetamidase n=1 Tax=Talaromyces proteolyticus TaxID=1131652 RepID=A0AAD4KQC9_9EURO|nr:acetamidase [Talaromyces proteolyticus]KAH8697040.1 acetamidase [Talaromyces proteolyticus]